MSTSRRMGAPGPFKASWLEPKSEYELHNGHPIRVSPTGGGGARSVLSGGSVIRSDPAVEAAGADPGFAPDEGTLRAPDVAVLPKDAGPGWIRGVPPLAIEYADRGQDEEKLQEKIADLMKRGTRYMWVVRLVGPRRVEIYEQDKPVRLAGPGEELLAPGVLQNPVLTDALWDPREADRATLRNLLNRFGYRDIDAVREEGREEGRVVALREAVLAALAGHGIATDATFAARLAEVTDAGELLRWITRAATATRIEDVCG